MDAVKKAMDDRVADENMRIGYVAGLIEGWKAAMSTVLLRTVPGWLAAR
jgi:hypothetical protein